MRLFTIFLLLSSNLLCSGAKIDDLRKAAEQGDAEAQSNLGRMYDGGEGVPEDDVEAMKWYRKAAEQGLAMAQYNLGGMYASGKGETRDYVEAVKWLRKAADQGHAWAQYRLGAMYDSGRGVAEDDVMAYMWWNLAAAQGNDHSKKAKGMLSEEMTREQIAEAQKLSREWLAKRSE
jgi:TPR repeat protein|tara:strand:+ start:168 stop:695 length:528 start_codon:yes stop_codon:yes gene_type:complete